MKLIYEQRPENVYAIGLNMNAFRTEEQLARLIIKKKDFSIGNAVKAISVNGVWFTRAPNQTELEQKWLTTPR